MGLLDIGILLAFLGYCAYSGFQSKAKASESLEEYFLAGRTLPGWKAGLSMAATQFAADTPLLITGLIATAGLFALWRLWIYAIAFLLMGFLLGAPWRRAGVLTDAELAELRYGSRLATGLRAVKAIYFGLLFNCAVMAMVLFAATRVAEPFLRWDLWLPPALLDPVVRGIEQAGLVLTADTATPGAALRSASNLISLLAIIAVTALYSTTGGLRAVVNTDVVQLAIALLATLGYAGVVLYKVGGPGSLVAQLQQLYGQGGAAQLLALTPDRASPQAASSALLAVIAVQWFAQMNSDGTGYLAQRTMACRSDRDARTAAIIFVGTQILLRSLLWIPIGLGLLVLIPAGSGALTPAHTAAREATYIQGIAQYLPVGLKGLMLTGMLAALASTLDTHLNWGASYFTNDLYKRIYCELWRKRAPSPRTQVWVARGSNLLILAISLGVLTRLQSIQSAWQTTLLLGAGMGVPLLLRWLWGRMTAGAELGALLASMVLAPLLLRYVSHEAVRMLLMTVLTAAVAVAVAWLGPSDSAAGVRAFYERVRPPGFWAAVAAQCGDDPRLPLRRLARGLIQTVLSAASVFCLLVGLATWIFGSPAPAALPRALATLWPFALTGLGALGLFGVLRSRQS